jgi:hypothetical protein
MPDHGSREVAAAGAASLAPPLARRPAAWLAISLCFLLFALRVAHVAWESSPTFDEPKHIATGFTLLARGWCCLGRDNTPLTALNALPLYLCGQVPLISSSDAKSIKAGADPAALLRPRYFMARMMQLPLGFLLLAAAFFLVGNAFGLWAGSLAALLVALEPNITAFASLASPDFQVTALLFAAVVVATPLASGRVSWRRTPWLGVLCGLALLAKYSALAFAPALVLVLALLRQWRALAHALAAFGIGAVIVALAYELPPLTHGLSFAIAPRLDETMFTRALDLTPDQNVGFFAGLDVVRNNARTGFPVYFFGALDRSFVLFYPAVVLLKTPIAWLVLAALGLVCWIRAPRQRGSLAVMLAASGVLFGLAMASRFNLGLRHVLLISPVLSCLAAAGLVLGRGRMPAKLVLLAVLVGTGLRYHPHELAYFNELIGGPEQASTALVDSSLDWGQDLWQLAPAARALGVRAFTGYLHVPVSAAQLGVFVNPPKEVPPHGWCAVSISKLRGLGKQDYETYRVGEFFSRLKPVARIGYSTYLYFVPR